MQERRPLSLGENLWAVLQGRDQVKQRYAVRSSTCFDAGVIWQNWNGKVLPNA